jgi:uncharacterized membrane protein YhaH (DUF805 family)
MHWFIDPIQNQYADFTGRTTRKEYWMFILIFILLYIPFVVIAQFFNLPMLTLGFNLVLLIPSIAIVTRRLHDTGRSGWWQLISFVPVIGSLVLVVLLVLKSDGDNAYGAAAGISNVSPGAAASNEQDVTPSAPGSGTPDMETKEASQETSPEQAVEPENTKQGFGS